MIGMRVDTMVKIVGEQPQGFETCHDQIQVSKYKMV